MYCATNNYYDIVADQGATLNRVFFLKTSTKTPIVLTGYTGRMHIRASASSSEIVETITSQNGQLTINPLLGRVDILLTPAETAALEPKVYAYDIELESPEGDVTKFIAGKLTVRSETTY